MNRKMRFMNLFFLESSRNMVRAIAKVGTYGLKFKLVTEAFEGGPKSDASVKRRPYPRSLSESYVAHGDDSDRLPTVAGPAARLLSIKITFWVQA